MIISRRRPIKLAVFYFFHFICKDSLPYGVFLAKKWMRSIYFKKLRLAIMLSFC